MAEEILRLKTIVIPDNAGMRQVTQNLQNIKREGTAALGQVKTSADAASRSLQGLHRDAQAAGQMIGRVFGAFGASVTTGAIAQRIHTLSKEVVDLSYSSRELGLSERYVRAFMNTAERAGVAGDAMKGGLGTARQALEGLNFAGSELRNTMIQLGGRETARRLAAIPDQGKRTIEFFKYLNQLMESGPAGRRGAEAIAQAVGLPLQALRVQIQDVESEYSRLKDRTDEEKRASQQLRDEVVRLGVAFDGFLIKAIPGLTSMLDLTNKSLDAIKLWVQIYNSVPRLGGGPTAPLAPDAVPQSLKPQTQVPGGGGAARPTTPGEDWAAKNRQKIWEFFGFGKTGGGGGPLTGGLGIVNAMVGGSGMPDLRGAAGEDRLQDEETTEEGTFKALVRFDSYTKMGRNLGAGGGPGPGGGGGLGGGGGPPGTGGGYGGGGSEGATTTQTPGGATVPGTGTGGPLGMPMVPGAPGAVTAGAPAGVNAPPGAGGGVIPPALLAQAKQMVLSGGKPDEVQAFLRKHGENQNEAWCGHFAAAVVKEAGGTPPAGAATASNWRNWGTEVAAGEAKPGDIAVRRGTPTGQGGSHVTIVGPGGVTGKGFEAVGGNQRHGVSQHPVGSYQFFRGQSDQPATARQEGETTPGGARIGDTPARFANVRTNNPGAQYPSDQARRFGMTGTDIIGGGHKIAKFPTGVHGAASNMALLQSKYVGMTVGAAMRKWSGGSRGVPGPGGTNYDPNMVITPQMAADPNFSVPFMKALTTGEAPGRYPLSDAQWSQAHEWAMSGGVPQGAVALGRGDTKAIDRANGAQTSAAPSSVNVDVRHDGSKATAKADTKGPAFADTKVANHTQMQPTAEYGNAGVNP